MKARLQDKYKNEIIKHINNPIIKKLKLGWIINPAKNHITPTIMKLTNVLPTMVGLLSSFNIKEVKP